MKKVFLSLPMSGRTQENIKFTIKAMTKKAKEILGEDVEVRHLANLTRSGAVDIFANPGMYNMMHATTEMMYCDYFMGFGRAALLIIGAITNSEHKGCILEEELWQYSQRHDEYKYINLNEQYIVNNKLPYIDVESICEFIPELNIKDKVHSFDLLMHSPYGLKAKMEEIKETSCTAYYHMTDIFELFEYLINKEANYGKGEIKYGCQCNND